MANSKYKPFRINSPTDYPDDYACQVRSHRRIFRLTENRMIGYLSTKGRLYVRQFHFTKPYREIFEYVDGKWISVAGIVLERIYQHKLTQDQIDSIVYLDGKPLNVKRWNLALSIKPYNGKCQSKGCDKLVDQCKLFIIGPGTRYCSACLHLRKKVLGGR